MLIMQWGKFFSVLVFLLFSAHASWYANWNFRKPITNHFSCSGDLTNFPLLVTVSNDSDLQAHASNNGYDIIFTLAANTNKLDHEIEYYSNGTLIVWVKMPLLSASVSESNILFMYFDKNKSINPANASNVWTAEYKGVWHFSEVAGVSVYDSSSNNAAGSADTGVTFNTNGKIGKCFWFDGINPDITFSDTADYDNFDPVLNQDFTISAWVNTTAADGCIMGNRGGASGIGFDYRIIAGKARTYLKDDNDAGFLSSDSTAAGYNDGLWHYMTVTFDRDGTRIYYKDGQPDGSSDISARNSELTNRFDFVIGRVTATAGTIFSNFMDEPRLIWTLRSPGWILRN